MDLDSLAKPIAHGKAAGSGWRVRRVELRSPVSPDAWPLARVELQHPQRGVVTDIASAPGELNAAFVAAGHIVGLAPRLMRYAAQSTGVTPEGNLIIEVEIELEFDGNTARGRFVGTDVVSCSVGAWLDAVSTLGNDI